MKHRSIVVGILAALFGTATGAQVTPAPRSSGDSVFARARQLVLNGNGAAGRVLVDSMVTATAPDTPAYAEALYWRATLAATSADSERDFRRVVVEYPLSSRAGESLLQLSQLEVARGDRAAATTHLQRFLLENPRSTERTRAALLLVRLAFEQNETQLGCTILGRALREVPESSVEVRNQLTYYSPRCAAVDTNQVTQKASSDSAAKRDSTRRDSVAASKAHFTLQVAAYPTRTQAEALAKRLKGRGLEARVVGTVKPFRVRIGRYATRAEATAAAKELKAKKIDAFVADIGSDDK